MTDRRLLVLDTHDVQIVRRITNEGSRWDILLLGIDERWFRRVSPELPPADARLHYLDVTNLARDVHESVREFVLDTIGRLGNLTVDCRPMWHTLAEAGSSWWYAETSEKGPYRTPLVSQLYALAMFEAVRRRTSYAGVVVATSHNWFAESVARHDGQVIHRIRSDAAGSGGIRRAYWRHAGAAVVTVLVARVAGWIGRWPGVDREPGQTWVFSFLPSWWAAPLDPAAAQERFFAEPPSAMPFACWTHGPRFLWRSRSALAAVIRARQILVLNRYVPWRAVLGVMSPARYRRVMQLIAGIRKMSGLMFAGVDAAPLVIRDLERSLTGGEMFQDELLARAVAKFADAYQPECVLYRAEFQPSEQALLAGLRGRAHGVGFVHYPFGRRYLPTYERHGSNSIDERVPGRDRFLPDGMMTCGDAGRDHLVDAGYPPHRIALCGPQRHPHLVARLRQPVDRAAARQSFGLEGTTPVFLVAIAIVQSDTEALFGALLDAVEPLGRFRLLVRTHPNRPSGDLSLQRAIEWLGPQRATVLPAGASLYEAIVASDAMITIGSTVAFEAMALGCQPIAFETPATYAATSLAEFGDSVYVVHDAAQLRHALREVLGRGPEALARRERWRDAVVHVLGNLSTPLPRQLDGALADLSPAFGVPLPMSANS